MTRRDLLWGGISLSYAPFIFEQSANAAPKQRVRTGIEVLQGKRFGALSGLKVGLVTNPTGILPDFTSTIECLFRAPNVKLRALFGPEHGVRGDIAASEYIASSTDSLTGLPVYSLYGRTRSPTAEMLRGLDALVFDIQDIGARSYTYISTMGAVMDGAAKHRIPVIVLDRPNPIGLNRIEGGPTKPGFESFVSKYPTAYLHGMTVGELGKMFNGQGWLTNGATCDLTVIACENLTRNKATWEEMGGLPWVPPSPHIPQATTPHFYAATGITGELISVSIGIGYPQPFELAGAPGMGAVSFARELTRRQLPGVTFRPHSWVPYYGTYKDQHCDGVQIYLNEPKKTVLTRINFEVLDAMRTLVKGREFFKSRETSQMFDFGCGTDRVRKAFQSGANSQTMWDIFNEGRDQFARDRKPYLLYS